MASFHASYCGLSSALGQRYGSLPAPRRASNRAEAVLAAFLRLTHEPARVSNALDAMRDGGLLDDHGLADDSAEIAEALRDSGIELQPAVLKRFIAVGAYLARLGPTEELDDLPTEQLRDELREIPGIGAASADALLLYGFERPVYPVDRATYRVLVRHGWIDPDADYDEASALISNEATDGSDGLARLSYGFERVAREFCKVKVAKCDRCPLRPLLPEGGPLDPSE
jgi:endonuclease-3 related protein